jgi:hypothetical protein
MKKRPRSRATHTGTWTPRAEVRHLPLRRSRHLPPQAHHNPELYDKKCVARSASAWARSSRAWRWFFRRSRPAYSDAVVACCRIVSLLLLIFLHVRTDELRYIIDR